MSNPRSRGRDNKGKTPGLPMDNSHGTLHNHGVREIQRESLSAPASSPESQAQQALNDAQQGLHSLLNPPVEDDQPHIISLSGASRNQRRGRVAGPSVDSKSPELAKEGRRTKDEGRQTVSTEIQPAARVSSAIRPSQTQKPSSLVLSPSPIPRRNLIATQTRNSIESAREYGRMLVYPVDGESTPDLDIQAAHKMRRNAAQWVTRYATHAVILLVIGVLITFSGLRTLTVAQAYPRSLLAVGQYTGTDFTGDAEDDSAGGRATDPDSQDYQITLPRTELGSTIPPSANAAQAHQPGSSDTDNEGQQVQASGPVPRSADVNRYTVVQGDTIDVIAQKFSVMPETVMGSNGILDPEEVLALGRVLIIPPIDGMYYVAAKGDTVTEVAHRFQVDPEAIISYSANKINSDGTIEEGTPLVVPRGMMPERETAITYKVQDGDTLKRIATRFGVDVPTMINSNDIPDPDNLQPGAELRVLPVQGMEYKVRKGDTVIGIADRYGTTPQMITDYLPNHLSLDSTLQIDQVILLPGGSPPEVVAAARVQPSARGPERPPERPPDKPQPPPKPQSKEQPKPQPKRDNSPKVGTGHMIWPVDGVITQYFTRRHNGLDIAINAGTPIHAADSGEVIWAGWRTDGLGYCVMVDHQNGLTTVYGHMIRQPPVYVGQYLKRGQVIGYIGSTGHSTGPHVHFMIKHGGGDSHDYRNPLAYLGK